MKLHLLKIIVLAASALLFETTVHAQENLSAKGKEVYDQVKAFQLAGAAEARGLTIKRDRAVLTFSGTFYFAAPVEGRVTGAVFVGDGTFRAEVPPSDFEKENVKRLLGTDVIESDFRTAVLRFTDDTAERLGLKAQEGGQAGERAQKLASELNPRILKETGANLAARVALSLLNDEKPGFFFANFDGGSRGRFSLLLDHQNRIPVANFGLNAGDKGVIFAYTDSIYGNEVWMAFYSLEDYQRNQVEYSDVNDLIDIAHQQIYVDVRDPGSRMRLTTRITAQTRSANLRALSFVVGESLSEEDSMRQKKQMRLKSAKLEGTELAAVQEDWEGGLTVFLPRALQAGQKLELELALEGDFMRDSEIIKDCFYPASNSTWYPRHGYLDRATYDLTFLHRKNRRIASIGQRLSEEPSPDDKEALVTKYRMQSPVPIATFAVGPFERHTDSAKWEKGGEPTPIEFNSVPGDYMAVKEDFILAELNNSLRYFSMLFGKYPYPIFSAAFHPFGFGQGLPGLLMIPPADSADKRTYSFIAHETAHQWWGDIVAWRSYRDQWLSEGFAEYSGTLYTALRSSADAQKDLVNEMRRSLKDPPEMRGPARIGKGRLADVGPIILGHRLNTSKTLGAYQTLIYNKGALVLRMLHFLFSDPATGDGTAFFKMMTDFVDRYRDDFASTDDFRRVANEHFVRTPIARKYNLANLDWFFVQWVYQTGLPSYQLEYQIEDQPGGGVLVTGTVTQEDVPERWFMVLPLVFTFGEKQWASGTVHAFGPKTPFSIKLPARPRKVELDPNRWILSERTSTKGK
ncbi:MAG TPA: M1 family aminopeptidase [Pyrinomonadaceae bacterium]|nr:M1 family aminopeptidase [Pyrinomonadaceae bacterium]